MGGDFLFAVLALVVAVVYLFRRIKNNRKYRRK